MGGKLESCHWQVMAMVASSHPGDAGALSKSGEKMARMPCKHCAAVVRSIPVTRNKVVRILRVEASSDLSHLALRLGCLMIVMMLASMLVIIMVIEVDCKTSRRIW